jgi:hypothetical protein
MSADTPRLLVPLPRRRAPHRALWVARQASGTATPRSWHDRNHALAAADRV